MPPVPTAPLPQVGLNADRVRFRQHLQHEMAHYAEDCWDFEVECSYGWVECAGLADRSAYDLNVSAWGTWRRGSVVLQAGVGHGSSTCCHHMLPLPRLGATARIRHEPAQLTPVHTTAHRPTPR